MRDLVKCPSGIQGLDEITGGGLPQGRPTLICGDAGTGKTLFGIEFLVNGATQYREPGVFLAFEETAEDLAQNVASLGLDLDALVEEGKLSVDYVHVERSEIEETGEYDLDGLFIRLGYAIDSIGAKRVVLDTLETLFGGLSNVAILRSELRRLFRWLKDRGITAIITAERGEGRLTRHGMEEYVSDCVIALSHHVTDQVATRRIRVVKYRGSTHGTNEYPFLIDEGGIDILPITSVGLDHSVSSERISTGIAQLDTMLGGEGYYRGSSILISGTAGVGKTSLAATLVEAACRRGERAVYFAFEESQGQLVRNMRSIGIDLEPWIRNGQLEFHAARPSLYGLETHLAAMYKTVRNFKPQVMVVDPITNFVSVGTDLQIQSMVMRLVDFLKSKQVTAAFTSLTSGGQAIEATNVGISSLVDTWFLLRDVESNGERNRVLYVLKSRGMSHSNQVRELRFSERGIELTEVYLGPEGVLTGSSRLAQEAREKADALRHRAETEHKQRQLEHKRKAMEAQIAALRASFEAEQEELERAIRQDEDYQRELLSDREAMAHSRQAEVAGGNNRKSSRRGERVSN